jgi:dihydroorotate dehydrogenase electron transfer subunit
MALQEKAKIKELKELAPGFICITFHSPQISQNSLPGQFVNIRVSNGLKPLLRKPLSIHNVEGDTFEILFESVGEGTKLLAQSKVGEELDILGPLGNGFSINGTKTAVLIGGGMGVAPLLYLANSLKGKVQKLQVFIGAREKERLVCESELKPAASDLFVCTDDGSYGEKGLVTDLFRHQLTTYNLQLTTIYACGPRPMLKALSELAGHHKISCQLSLEEYMACAIGACRGCVVKTRKGYKTVCNDGPVFEAREIVW